MFGFGSKKQLAVTDRSKVVGIDLTATRARAVALAAGRTRPLVLDGSADDLLLALNLDRRSPDVGRSGVAICRKTPHLVCSNFLPQLSHPKRWQAGRHALSAEAALRLAFDKLYSPVTAETDAAGLALPAYLSAVQVRAVTEAAAKAKLPIRGTVAAPLAVAAHRARWVLGGPSEPVATDDAKPDWVVPIRPQPFGPVSVVLIDADEFAMTAAVVRADPQEVVLTATATWPRTSLKAWKDRLIDGMSDRCVRICRRDPRDSADAEQALYDQLDPALDRVAAGQPVTLTVRSSHWYQDLIHQPDDFDAFCAPLARTAADGLRELLRTAGLPVPPRAVWLSHTAARLPGLAPTIHQATPEQTEVMALPANAVADATAVLVPYWLTGMLPRVHLDVAIPLSGTGNRRQTRIQARTPWAPGGVTVVCSGRMSLPAPTRGLTMARAKRPANTYRDLEVWQRGMELAEAVYRLSKVLPSEERFGLCSQMQRAAVSVPANIAEGNARLHRGDYLRHLSIARGSLAELETHMILAGRLGFITREQATPAWKLATSTGQLLNKLMTSLSQGAGSFPDGTL